jgi:hypothetical protein
LLAQPAKTHAAAAQQAFRGFRAAMAVCLRQRHAVWEAMWELGRVLDQTRAKVGARNWLLWLDTHLPDLGTTPRSRYDNSRRCIRFYRANKSYENSRTFEPESVRKLRGGYMPVEERPQLKGDEKVTRAPHHFTFANHFAKWDRQRQLGRLPTPPQELMRRDLEPTIRRLIQLLGSEWVRDVLDNP